MSAVVVGLSARQTSSIGQRCAGLVRRTTNIVSSIQLPVPKVTDVSFRPLKAAPIRHLAVHDMEQCVENRPIREEWRGFLAARDSEKSRNAKKNPKFELLKFAALRLNGVKTSRS
ncbi:MAG: hypothetical protein WAN35_03005 [Terracidiphilus sp.]